jgi:hypothetical protein
VSDGTLERMAKVRVHLLEFFLCPLASDFVAGLRLRGFEQLLPWPSRHNVRLAMRKQRQA